MRRTLRAAWHVLDGMHKHELLELTRPIEGWLFDDEAWLLFQLAQRCTGRGAIVEIGSWKGKSTVCLAKGSESGPRAKVYAIDPHTGSEEHQGQGRLWTFDEFRQNVRNAGVESIIVPMVTTSIAAAKEFNEPVEFVFIDGAHDYESARQDFEYWFPKVIEGGVVAFHDTSGWEGPKRVAREALFKSGDFRDASFRKSIAFGTKVKHNSAGQRLRNRAMLSLKGVHDPLLSAATTGPLGKSLRKLLRRG